jgi:hypothetical protein
VTDLPKQESFPDGVSLSSASSNKPDIQACCKFDTTREPSFLSRVKASQAGFKNNAQVVDLYWQFLYSNRNAPPKTYKTRFYILASNHLVGTDILFGRSWKTGDEASDPDSAEELFQLQTMARGPGQRSGKFQ